MLNNRRLLTFAIALATVGAAVALAPSTATAQLTAQFNVRANVPERCQVELNDLNFGDYDPVVVNAVAPLDGSTTFRIRCTPNSSVTIGLQEFAPNRFMTGPNFNTLNYELYNDAAGGTVWGQASGTVAFSPANANWVTYTIYGRVPGNQMVETGAYSQQVTMYVNY